MKNTPASKEPLSTLLRRHPHRSKTEIVDTIRWVGFSALFTFLALLATYLLSGQFTNALITAIGIIPIVIALFLLRQNAVSTPSTILSVTIILTITWLATHSQGLYDIGILGYPVILIVVGLILRGRVITYLTLLVILCLAWLSFGNILGYYEPIWLTKTPPEDFFFATIIIIIAGNAIYRLTGNVYNSLKEAEDEIAMRKKVETEKEIVIQQLERKNKELDRFAIRVSHDLKAPLITIAGFLGFLDRDIKSENFDRVERNLSQINEAAKTMGKFVDELLDLSRVGRITNPPVDVAFESIVQDALKVVEGSLREKQVQVEIDSNFPIVHVDKPRMIQVVQNLISNAIKFMGDQPAPRIQISYTQVDGRYVFSISDNGIGIAPTDHERIFELFNKIDPNTDGIGIGLGVVKRIIEVHNGKIWVESDGNNNGSNFKFTLQGKQIK